MSLLAQVVGQRPQRLLDAGHGAEAGPLGELGRDPPVLRTDLRRYAHDDRHPLVAADGAEHPLLADGEERLAQEAAGVEARPLRDDDVGLEPGCKPEALPLGGLAVGPFLDRLRAEGDDIRVLGAGSFQRTQVWHGLLISVQADRLGHERPVGVAVGEMGVARAEIDPDVAVRDQLLEPRR